MFTGIVETFVPVLSREKNILKIARPAEFKNLKIGQSIAVSGACLSILKFENDSISFEILDETFARTNLKSAEFVNLERALPVDGRFEGHVVSGHVDGVLKFLRKSGEKFFFEMSRGFEKFFIEKGSISLNGVSLTIAAENEKEFCICLISQTLGKTNLGKLKPGDAVNFEIDFLAKLFLKNHGRN